jgi:Zn-finger nucleic acid-binding protein
MPANGPCPSCSGELVEVERSGIHIDACRQCRGVFLDRGELDEILKREREAFAGADDEDFLREVTGGGKRERYGFDKRHAEKLFEDYRSHRSHKKRKKSFLDELFD